MSLYVNGVLQAGINDIPSYTRAEYEALTEKPEYWICTDMEYNDLPSEYVTYESGTVKDALDDLTEQIDNKIIFVTYDIPNDTTAYNYSYPSGFSINNCALVGARCATRYGSIVDYTYSNFAYWGDFTMRESFFIFQPKVAGNSTRITFLFTEIHT